MFNRHLKKCGYAVFVMLLMITVPVIAAYKAHHNDRDTANFLKIYSAAKDTKLDNCYLCHTGGDANGKYLDSCDYCHYVYGFSSPHPDGSILRTLNSYGKDYLAAGRTPEALTDIAGLDSDSDGFTNGQEIAAVHLPGDGKDYPGLAAAPAVIYSRERLHSLPRVNEFMAFDTAKAGDYYAKYTGVSIWELLSDAGINEDATDIVVYSVDGYSRNFTLAELKQNYHQNKFATSYPWVKWPENVKYKNNQLLPGTLQYILAYERDDIPLLESKIVNGGDGGKFFLNGEGPYHLIVPSDIPVTPDRSQWSIDRDDPPYPYNPNRPVTRNADYCVRAVVAIQVNSADNKSYQYDWTGEAWKMIENGEIVVYGAISPQNK